MTKRFLLILQVEIALSEDDCAPGETVADCAKNYGATDAADYVARVLKNLEPDDTVVDITAYEVKAT